MKVPDFTSMEQYAGCQYWYSLCHTRRSPCIFPPVLVIKRYSLRGLSFTADLGGLTGVFSLHEELRAGFTPALLRGFGELFLFGVENIEVLCFSGVERPSS